MPTSTVVSHWVTARASAGYSAHLGARLSTLIGPCSDAPGCLHFALQKSMTEEDVWVISGLWSSELTMNAWFAAPELGIFSELVTERIVSHLDFQTFASVSAVEAEAAYGVPAARKAG